MSRTGQLRGKTTVDSSDFASPGSYGDIAAEISRYCASHPDAGDTLDGIAWWLMHQRFQDTRAEIAAAAETLLRQGQLHRRVMADGTVLYCCRPLPGELSGLPGDDDATNTDQ